MLIDWYRVTTIADTTKNRLGKVHFCRKDAHYDTRVLSCINIYLYYKI